MLPLDIDLPFRIDLVRWNGPPAFEARGLAGHYRYRDAQHVLELAGVDLAGGHYQGRARLQGAAPMALELALQGRLAAPLAEGRKLDVAAEASLKGTLATAGARLQLEGLVKPAAQGADKPMLASVRAQLAPWQPQPVIEATAELSEVDLARLWPEAPATSLSGALRVGPDAAAATGGTHWKAVVDIRNSIPGPWDKDRLPAEHVEADLSFDGTNWTVTTAQLRAGRGQVGVEGRWSPAPAPWQLRARVSDLRPGELHTQLAGPPIDGRIAAQQRGEAIAFDLALKARGSAGTAALRGLQLQEVVGRGEWQRQVLDLRALRIEAEGARVEGKLQLRVAEQAGSGELSLSLPGADAQLQGRIAPAQGGGELKARVGDAAALQAWIEKLPGLSAVFQGASAQGGARLDARWEGGWQAVQRRLQNIDQPVARSAEPSVQATLDISRLDLRLPSAVAPQPPIQLRAVRAELSGSLAQATLRLQGQVASGTRKLTLDTRAAGGLERPGQWRASLDTLRLQAQDSTRPGPWTVESSRAVSATIRASAARLDIEASA
ncbi:MAG TPA: hypothetical protein VES36_08745, partial [Candidatus Limnocylindrales bacterium]|nr:hypothetical protein [Candidatus Limnocylindrales bacterium]